MHKLAVVFPGQGSQYVGMGKKEYDEYDFVRQIYEEASDLAGLDIKQVCFEMDLDRLTQTENAQMAIFVTSYAAFRVFEKSGIRPILSAGHSLGELTALTCAGALTFDQAIRLVKSRGEIMRRASVFLDGGMIAVGGVEIATVERICSEFSRAGRSATIANYNSPDQIVVAGHNDVLAQVGNAVKQVQGRYAPLKVNAPFHTPIMVEAAKEFQVELGKYTFKGPQFPVISNVYGNKPYSSADEIGDYLTKHLASPVQWKTTVDFFVENGVEVVVELGPKNVLKKLVEACTKKMKVFSSDDPEDMTKFGFLFESSLPETAKNRERIDLSIKRAKELFGKKLATKIDYSDEGRIVTTPVTLCLAGAICVPNKNLDKQEYNTGVLEPYANLRKKQSIIEKEQRYPNEKEVDEAFEMLFSVFKTKQVPLKEQLQQLEVICTKLENV